LIGKLRHELLRGKVSEASAHHDPQQLFYFDGAKRVGWTTVGATPTIVCVWRAAPALHGASRDPSDLTRLAEPRTSRLGFVDGREN
jgi:hypothetical protein